MYEYKVVRVAVQTRGASKGWNCHELRLVRKLVGGGHYLHSRGCTVIRRSGPVRGSLRLAREYEAECARLQGELEAEQRRAAEEALARYAGSYSLCATPPEVRGAHLAMSR